ncbi:PIN domain-containing protein [Candidatus Woesearchaeota archaeon]|nr:PIN domain-containing protein [Candidatus Woesearchaeota archaeon]
MNKYVIDTYAWVEYFIGSEKGERVKQFVETSENEIFTSIVTIAEITSITKRENRDAEQIYLKIIDLSTVYGLDKEFSKEGGLLHAEIKKKIKDFGLIDAFILLTARKLNAKVITGDKHFKGFKEAILI